MKKRLVNQGEGYPIIPSAAKAAFFYVCKKEVNIR
jgi:hypothetical protein